MIQRMTMTATRTLVILLVTVVGCATGHSQETESAVEQVPAVTAGHVSMAAGAINKINGDFTVDHKPGSGIYSIRFAEPFDNRPVVVATADAQNNPGATCEVEVRSSSLVVIHCRTTDGAHSLVDAAFFFVAVGDRSR